MTNAEKLILAEIKSLRSSFDSHIIRLHSRIDTVIKENSKTRELAVVNKVKTGAFVVVSLMLGTVISYYVKS